MTRRWPATLALFFLVLGAGCVEASLVDFARCLTRARATYYTASWCPHCARQNEMFGAAFGYLRSVDCTHGCREANISSFPTWVFADGSRFSGVASFELLASRTGCRLDGPRREDPPAPEWTRRGTRERYLGGAKFIDVQGR